MKTKIITIIFIALTFFSFGQYEQYINLLSPYLSGDSIQNGFIYFNTPNNFQPGVLYQTYRQNAPDLNNNMVLTKSHIDSAIGLTHYRYQQTFMDIPIEGAGCIEHHDANGSLLFINAKIADSIKKSPIPKISGEDAIKYALDRMIQRNDKIVFAWKNENWEHQIRKDEQDPNASWYPEAKLVWAIDTMKNMHMIIPGSRYNLAYKISITTISPEFETFIYYVNAYNGQILKFHSTRIYDGIAEIYGYGNKEIDTRWKGGATNAFILESNNYTRHIHTKKSGGTNNIWGLISNVKDGDNHWHSADIIETSTHYHVSNAWDYFRNYFGRTGQDNSGIKIRVRSQINDANAFFDPKGNHNNLNFGHDPTGGHYGEEPSVVGHEFTHGVTHHTAGLAYSYESGALNESFSDIFGVAMQAKMLDNGNTDWIIGNFISNTTMGERSLKDPKNYGIHYENNAAVVGQPDTYGEENWYNGNGDDGGVHVNSGVQNHWFYILSSGEYGYNDLNDYYNVHGIGMTKASKIAYYALTNLLISSSQYFNSRQATITAAKLLYGKCSIEYQACVDAWYAVGVGDKNDCTYTLSVDNFSVKDVNVYPNPSNGEITIDLPEQTSLPIMIYDISGKLVRQFNSNEIHINKDISELNQGIYFIHINFNSRTVVKKLILK